MLLFEVRNLGYKAWVTISTAVEKPTENSVKGTSLSIVLGIAMIFQ